MKKASTSKNAAVEKGGSFFAHLKRVCRDPIKSSAEAIERKKELKKYLYICIAGTLITFLPSFISANIVTNILSVIGIPFFLATISCILMLYAVSNAVGKFENIECTNCKKRLVYGENVEYEVLRKWEVVNKSTNNNSNRIRVEQTVNVEVGVSVTCPDCGNVNRFATEFAIEKWVDGVCQCSYPIPEMLEVYFEDVKPLSLKTFGIWKRKK